jgi:hypothetical protein
MSHRLLPWYGGAISRGQALQALHDGGNSPGDFIVRDSETTAGAFVLGAM